jgi:hypothetical protein
MEFKNKANKEIDNVPMGRIYRFVCWCSGARLYILKKCPTDYNLFFGIGMIVILTGLMAVLSGSYAFFTVFQNQWLALGFGLFWGFLIFFIDWYLVSSLRKENKFGRELLTASPRFVLAIFLAFVISRPLELKLFENEINKQLINLNQVKYNQYKDNVNQAFAEIEELTAQNQRYQEKVDQLLQQKNQLFNLVIEEAEGRSPIQKAGKGSVYREKKEEYDQVANDYSKEMARLYPLIEKNNQRIAELKSLRDVSIQSGSQVAQNTDGFLARIEAYNELSRDNRTINITGWFILGLFICIEIGPMFVKLISRRGAYDELLNLEETKITSKTRQEITHLNEKTYRIIELEREKSVSRLREEIANQSNYTKWVMEAQSEISHERINRWKNFELNKTDDFMDDYKPSIDELIEEAKIALKPN